MGRGPRKGWAPPPGIHDRGLALRVQACLQARPQSLPRAPSSPGPAARIAPHIASLRVWAVPTRLRKQHAFPQNALTHYGVAPFPHIGDTAP